ncbi:DUF802 domain-containing protein [Paracandidimonas soli]|uniref:Uncharacterized protein DUF802 n=1 Tax=Paracandidimonas soli TaxID=1917182 RepID=A0A4R3VHN7_9BURK|nr:DUF802 domain-containing protein [Paracandidimonas soli]TCV03278.1 uncharacterized protein DUF802 [Paracandidimonas soli]
MNRFIHIVVFLAGLAAIGWIGAGYVGSNPLALSMTLLIGAFYLLGAWELYRYHQDTIAMRRLLDGQTETPESLGDWLGQVPVSLRQAVRLRIEGERAGLPGPALTPYLAGLLVLLGMLGTFLGMVVTLRGTGVALEHATDLQAIRASLAAPVQGLGFAFGTSIAGVAASAMLGLLSALCRRERQLASQGLDAAAATVLRPYSQAWQREEAFRLLQQQASMMPALVDRLQDVAQSLDRHGQETGQRLVDSQQTFHARTEAAYAQLTASVEQSLRTGLEDSAKAAGAAIAPAVEALQGQTAAMPALTDRLAEMMAALERQGQEYRQQLQSGQDDFHARTEALQTRLAESLERQLKAGAAESAQAAGEAIQPAVEAAMAALARETSAWQDALSAAVRQQLADVAGKLDSSADAVSGIWNRALEEHRAASQESVQALQASQAQFAQAAGQQVSELLASVSQRLDNVSATVSQAWDSALSSHASTSQALAEDNRKALAQAAEAFEQHAMKLVDTVGQANAELREALQSGDEARLAAWSEQTGSITASLQAQWEQAAAASEARQQQICATLEQVATDISTHAAEQSQQTMAEIRQLVQAAAEAPKAAADVIGQLRAQISDGMARDNAMLEERSRMLETLETLLDSVNHASTQQRSAIDALVTTSSELLERVGTQFAQKVDEEAGKLVHVASQVTGSAVEVASLGEALGTAVQRFSDSNEALGASLQRIEAALEKAGTRSDEQLAYYVAQAREVVDLTLMSQKQILDELQRVASGSEETEAAQS